MRRSQERRESRTMICSAADSIDPGPTAADSIGTGGDERANVAKIPPLESLMDSQLAVTTTNSGHCTEPAMKPPNRAWGTMHAGGCMDPGRRGVLMEGISRKLNPPENCRSSLG
jgi:hypothetical protein